MWQDLVLTAAGVVFCIALLPSLKAEEKPALKTCAITAVTLYIMAAVDLTLGLWFTSACTFVTGILWTVLGIQSYKRMDRGRSNWR